MDRFYEKGADIVICGRREAVLREAAARIDAAPGRLLTVTADIVCEEDVMRLVAETVAWRGRIDVHVNNAAAMRIDKPRKRSLRCT